MFQQELDLFQISTCYAAELCGGTAEIMGTGPLEPDLLRRFGDHRPNRPVTEAFANFVQGTEQGICLDQTIA